MKFQLVSANLAGNLHQAATSINAMGLADYLFHMDSTGHSTVVIFKVPASMAPGLRKNFGVLPEYQANPKPRKISS